MLKKIIFSILILSLIAGGFFFLSKEKPFVSRQIPVSNHPEMFMDEENYSSPKPKEYYKSIEKNYKDNIKSLKSNKEKLTLIIQYIRDLGFEVDEEKETVQVLKYIKGSERTTSIRYIYSYTPLDFNTLLELNEYSNKTYKLKLPNPMGPDFIIDYDSLKEIDKVKSFTGIPDKVYLDNNKLISSTYRWLTYYDGNLEFKFITGDNEYFANGLKFEYENSRRNKGYIDLSVDLDPKTGKKRYVEFIID